MDDEKPANLINDPEIQRLKAQVDFSIEKEKMFWNIAGIKDGMEILEVGCGPGWMTKILLQEYQSSVVTGIDNNPKMVEAFKQILSEDEQKRSRIIFGSITENDLPKYNFDVAIFRVVLQYIQEAELAIQRVFDLLKPGGIIYVVDIDQDCSFVFHPKLSHFNHVNNKIMNYFASNNIINTKVARLLPGYFRNSGFVDLKFQSIAMHSDISGLDNFLAILQPMVHDSYFEYFTSKGVITKDEMQNTMNEIQSFLQLPEKIAFGVMFIVYGYKPI